MYPNVKYELHEYERLMGFISTDSDRGDSVNALRQQIKTEVGRIKQTFINEVFTFSDERHLERYVQYHQQALIRLMDETIKFENTRTQKIKWQLCYKGLQDLLSFIESYFSKYFDQDAKAPETYIMLTRKDLQANFEQLHMQLSGKSNDPKITAVMLYAIRKVIDDDLKSGITYRKLLYAKTVQKELWALVQSAKPETDITEDLRNLMLYLNYNAIKAFSYYTHYMDTLVSQTETRLERIEKLSYILKKINQVQLKPGIGYNRQAPALKDQLNNYIVEEMEHVQRVQQLSGVAGAQPNRASGIKIQLQLSVAQIACLIKLFYETEVMVNRNVTDLLRCLAGLVVSRKTETVSFDSLRAKYYNVEQGTQAAVKKLLLKMLHALEKS